MTASKPIPTRNDLSPAVRGKAVELLNQHLADTADLFTQMSRGLDQHLWMLAAHLAG